MRMVNTKGDGLIRFEGRPTDVIIAILGPKGVGKSTFTNALCKPYTAERAEVGHSLKACTVKLQAVVISPSSGGGRGRRWVIIDTPGFEKICVDELKVLDLISKWLTASYNEVWGMKLAGMIYLRDILQSRTLGETRDDFEVFHKLCGDDTPSVIVPCTTKWEHIEDQVGNARERELEDTFWKNVIPGQSTSHRFDNNPQSAWKIVTCLLEKKMNAAVRRIEKLNTDFSLLPYVSPDQQTDILCATDLVVLIMGPVGVGKSTFINTLCNKNVVKVGHGLRECTLVPRPVIVDSTCSCELCEGRRLVIVDTPSFNGSRQENAKILGDISNFLKSYRECHMRLGGVIYLSQSISDDPRNGHQNQDRKAIQKDILGDDALSSVVVGITNQESVDVCLPISEGVFWEEPSRDRSPVHNFQNMRACAWDLVNYLAHKSANPITLQIQKKPFDTRFMETSPRPGNGYISDLYRMILRLLGMTE